MVKNDAVTEAILEAKEWEAELDDADLILVSGGNITTDLVNYFKGIGQAYGSAGKQIGEYFKNEYSYQG